jgi:hypothetical protein
MLSARVLSVEDFFKLGVFTPASVQRDYVWDAQQSEDLFSDIERACTRFADEPDGSEARVSVADEDNGEDDADQSTPPVAEPVEEDAAPGYHLGEIVLRRLTNEQFEIFDGLQRATTLTILLCVIRDLTTSSALKSRIRSLIKSGPIYRVELPSSDLTLLKEIQTDEQAVRTFRRPVCARGMRLRRSRALFHGYLKNWGNNRLLQFGTFLLERTFLVVAETEYRALARQVFITANHRGIQLRPVDIFKGQLLDIAGPEEVSTPVAARWSGISQIVGEEIEGFMQTYDFIKRQQPQGPDHLAKLADHFEKNYRSERINDVMDEIQAYASAWQDLQTRLKSQPNSELGFDIWKLRIFKWVEWKPVALAWYKDFRDKKGKKAGGAGAKAEAAFGKRFAALHRACMVITLAKFSPVDRARIFGKALSQSDPYSAKGRTPGALAFPPRQIARAKETLGTPLYDDEIRLSLLRWIEACRHSFESLPVEIAHASIEHVLPQRPDSASQWLRDFPDEDERFSACHSIGNLALMDYMENRRITNDDFTFKLPTIKAQAEKYKSLGDIADKTAWTSQEIADRAERMIEFVCKKLNIAASTRP